MNQRQAARERLKKLARDVILNADTVCSIVDNNPNVRPTGSLDPETWTIARHNARKILQAIEHDTHIDPGWVQEIERLATATEDE